MNAMQYKIILPNDYDMSLIRERVEEKGTKTDNFEGLLFKAYLISVKTAGAVSNSYSPLYVWKDSKGMNQFIFGGFYDNIIRDFGWQNSKIGVPLTVDLSTNFADSAYLLEQTILINQQLSLTDVPQTLLNIQKTFPKNSLGKLIIYNPDKWQAIIFSFYEKKPVKRDAALYEILHISSNEALKGGKEPPH
ncbi:DUF4865 family protein [Enterococcus caccae]|uniref:DUF4865 domain-containing protein n=1 Tax=Enterococcus caccae ATCC BAA-1240 TaxID=1158612 RepID=R3WB68_9ENTE|nr:DUF4865 family protein [Enterococcus caccae]EOL45171.1 hypothetical protein UC7_01977 [Enterococcus caccae ATCC BAA-1240]EOT58578.1 hypothetical protein I580_02749 [Enterococcus caccae ATCC BAA-1240]OJG27093.1 hypothetical protein RU98_GL002873 [Enterococcus caccae]